MGLEVVVVATVDEAKEEIQVRSQGRPDDHGDAAQVADFGSVSRCQDMKRQPGETMTEAWKPFQTGDSYQTACPARQSNSARRSPPVLPMIEL